MNVQVKEQVKLTFQVKVYVNVKAKLLFICQVKVYVQTKVHVQVHFQMPL